MNQKKIVELINKLGTTFESWGANNPEKIIEIESKLSVTLPEDYREFLIKYGDVDLPGIWIFGTGQEDIPHCVSATLRFRKYGLPEHYVVIENDEGDEQYCLDTSQINNGVCPVVIWNRMWGLEDQSYSSFTEYFIAKLEYVIELEEYE